MDKWQNLNFQHNTHLDFEYKDTKRMIEVGEHIEHIDMTEILFPLGYLSLRKHVIDTAQLYFLVIWA